MSTIAVFPMQNNGGQQLLTLGAGLRGEFRYTHPSRFSIRMDAMENVQHHIVHG
jgi:hypothetical protein